MSVAIQANQKQILGAAIVDLLNGELTDETIAAIDSLKREDVPAPLSDLVGMIHGMTTLPRMRQRSAAWPRPRSWRCWARSWPRTTAAVS